MKTHPPYLDDEVLRKYLTGELSDEESRELKNKLDADPDGRSYLERMEKIWSLSAGIRDFESIDTGRDWNALWEKIGSSRPDLPGPGLPGAGSDTRRGTGYRSLAYRIIRIAAVFLLVSATAFFLYYVTAEGPLSRKAWVTVSTGEQVRDIVLPDGSTASLNTGSSLGYPVNFRGKKRSVKLQGEAYFEIARDEDKPFLVNVAGEASVEVLGTSFHLRTDPQNNRVFLNVVSGRVAFFPRGKKRLARELGPDERAVMENGRISQHPMIDLNFLSWKTRILEFRNTPLEEVVDQLGRHYRKEFRMAGGGLEGLALTGTYDNQSMEDVLEEIALVLNIDFREENGTILVTANENTNPYSPSDAH